MLKFLIAGSFLFFLVFSNIAFANTEILESMNGLEVDNPSNRFLVVFEEIDADALAKWNGSTAVIESTVMMGLRANRLNASATLDSLITEEPILWVGVYFVNDEVVKLQISLKRLIFFNGNGLRTKAGSTWNVSDLVISKENDFLQIIEMLRMMVDFFSYEYIKVNNL